MMWTACQVFRRFSTSSVSNVALLALLQQRMNRGFDISVALGPTCRPDPAHLKVWVTAKRACSRWSPLCHVQLWLYRPGFTVQAVRGVASALETPQPAASLIIVGAALQPDAVWFLLLCCCRSYMYLTVGSCVGWLPLNASWSTLQTAV